MRNKQTKKMVMAALMAALTVVATMVIRIPSLGPNGYVNIGDTMVLLSAWILGGWYGAAAAAIGSAMADLFCGYTFYAPGSFVIKAAMALSASLLLKAWHAWTQKKAARNISGTAKNIHSTTGYLLSGIPAELLMIGGYFLYESLLLGYGWAAMAAVISNCFQGISNIILGTILAVALSKTPIPGMLLQENQ